jgi:hypothetical protein
MFRRTTPIAVLLVAGCAALQPAVSPRVATSPSTRPTIGDASPFDPTHDPGRTDVPPTVPRATGSAQRRICRTSAWPTGWIAVAYEAASGDECPQKSGHDEHPVAILVRYAEQPRDATLDVCADQHVPYDWEDMRIADADVGQCPGAASNGGSATKRIRRVR